MSQESTAATATATASAPASSAWSAATPLTFRKEPDEGFPLGGAILLVVLMVAAVLAWWYGRPRAGRIGGLPGLPASWGRTAGRGKELRIVESVQAAGGMRLLVVEWAGGRRVLLGANGAAAPVTLDVVPVVAPPAGVER